MKRFLKVFFVLIILLNISALFLNNVSGDWKYEDEVKKTWTNQGDTTVITPVQKVTSIAIQVIRIVGTGVSLIMITYVAIKYMSAAPSEKAEFKKSATAFIVGAVVLFAATNILGIINTFANANITT